MGISKHVSPNDDPLLRQFDINADKNLLYDRLERIMEIDPLFLAALEEARTGTDAHAQEAADMHAARTLVERMRAVNQFVAVDGEALNALTRIYGRTREALRDGGDIGSILRAVHYPALRRWMAGVYPRELAEGLRGSPRIGRVACSEYSPETQLAALRLDPRALAQPVLDVGCGDGAALARHLRGLGIEAFGMDRRIADPGPWLTEADWMDYRFAPGTWGTIVSHMAFSNHMLYALRYEPARRDRCAGKYSEILASLAPGGSFHYSPGLPLFEKDLPGGRYTVESHPVFAGVCASSVTRKA
jgi:hypothetical protein